MDRSLCSKERPLINAYGYTPEGTRTEEDDELQYCSIAALLRRKTHLSPEKFNQIYKDTLKFFTVQEQFTFKQYQAGDRKPEEFYRDCASYLRRNFPNEMSNENDFKVMMNRLDLAMFGYDVLQPLIDNEDTTDIKICSPYDIRVRIKGKAYKSDAYFIDFADMQRFINAIAIRNKVDILSTPVMTFSDKHDKNYILRFTTSSPIITCTEAPYLHIRKVSKVKADFDELIRRGMLTDDIKYYLIDRAKDAKGIVFAGPPGSGKSTILNAWIEFIPKYRETLVIQENDELFTDQSGFMFKHVTHGFQGEPIITLEDLGRMALVEGCNEFIIGEVKGGEMRSAMTLLNAGGNIALTVHSTNAYETLDKLADLVKYGSDYSFEEARRMLKTVDTIVYLEGYKVREILECVGYNDQTHQYKYLNIYRYES